MITHTHTHTQRHFTYTHTDSAISLSIQFQFQLLTDFDNLIERRLLFNRLNRFLLDSLSTTFCCKLLLISFVYFQLSTLDLTCDTRRAEYLDNAQTVED